MDVFFHPDHIIVKLTCFQSSVSTICKQAYMMSN
jgi:hypothetical protein